MIRIFFSVLILTLILVFPFTSQAADRTGKYSIGVEGGYAIPLGDFGKLHDGSVFLGANGGYWINNKISAGVGLQYHLNYPPSDKGEEHSFNIFSITPQVKVYVFDGPITPMAELGLGMFRFGKSNGANIELVFNASGGIEIGGFIYEKVFLGTNVMFTYNSNFKDGAYYLTIGAGANYHF